MAVKKLKIAVISDLHCHPENQETVKNNTLLFSDKLRLPTNEHPVENLLGIIEDEGIKVNLVLSPGDFTHQSDKQGFFSGWSYVNELARALKAEVIATIGNHDIDSRHTYSNYSFDIPKKISQNFPMSKTRLAQFWDTGFVFVEETDFQILVVNSTHFHTHYDKGDSIENPAVKGKMDAAQIEQIEQYLKANNDPNKIKIGLVHHHPIQHARQALGEHDFIENGDAFLNVLGTYRFDLLIHGHKHDPWLRYQITGNGFSLPILSSGSFSATNQISWINKFNYFHVIEIIKEDTKPANGTLETFTFKNRNGWKKDRDDGFYPYSGFGYLDNLQQLADKIKLKLSNSANGILKWDTILANIPEIKFLTPDKMDEVEALLLTEKIFLAPKIGIKPNHIYHERD